MGREIRRVPPDWEHPKYTEDDAPRSSLIGKYRPLFDEDFRTASLKWLEECHLWEQGKHPNQRKEYEFYWQWHSGPPDQESYRDRAWTLEEATCYQVYETVSEGTPVTPAFADKVLLIEYLVHHGTFWDNEGWPRENAERFVQDEWAPSGMASPNTGFRTVNEEGFYDR